MTVLITGGAGFIGTYLCRRLLSEGYSVRSMDIRNPRFPVEGVAYIRGDVRVDADLKAAMHGVSAVYHFAAIVNVAECQEKPAESYQTNFNGTLNVLEAVRAEGLRSGNLPRLIFAGSSAVYGLAGKKGQPISEVETSADPLSFYASQKLASEAAVRLYHQRYNIPAVIFRFFNVYGHGQDPQSPYSGVITIFSRLAREGKDLPLHGKGAQTRDFVAVEDIARANALVLKLDPSLCTGQTINLGSGSAVTIRELAEIILRISSPTRRGESSLVDAPPREGDVPHSLADIATAHKLLNWAPLAKLEESLARVIS